MHPVLFTVGGFAVPSYGVMLATGLFVGLLIGTLRAPRDGFPSEWAWDLGILTMVCAIIGGRLEFVRTNFSRFLAAPSTIFALRDGGMVFYGGFVLTVLGFLVYARRRSVPALALLDMMAPSVGFGHAIGRIGCLLAGCCFGVPTSGWWSVTFPPGSLAPAGQPLVPTQIHEVLFNLILGTFLWFFPRRFVGQRFALLLLLYGAFRALNETVRGDSARGTVLGGLLTNAQFTSLILACVAAAIWALNARKAPAPPVGSPS